MAESLVIEPTVNSVVIVSQAPATLEIVTGGVQGTPGLAGNISADHQAAFALSGHRLVTLNGSGLVDYASADNLAHAGRVIGVTVGAVAQGEVPQILKSGELTEPSWNLNVSMPIYLGTNGNLTQVPPAFPESKFSLVVGFPISPTTVLFGVQPSIVLI